MELKEVTLHGKPVKHVNVSRTDWRVRNYSMKMLGLLSYSPLERWEKESVLLLVAQSHLDNK